MTASGLMAKIQIFRKKVYFAMFVDISRLFQPKAVLKGTESGYFALKMYVLFCLVYNYKKNVKS